MGILLCQTLGSRGMLSQSPSTPKLGIPGGGGGLGLPGAEKGPGRSRTVEHRPWRMGILQAEGDLEHPTEDAPTSLRRQNGSAVPQFP